MGGGGRDAWVGCKVRGVVCGGRRLGWCVANGLSGGWRRGGLLGIESRVTR